MDPQNNKQEEPKASRRSTVTSLAPRNMAEAMEFAKMLSESDFVPQQFKRKPGDIIAAIQFGAEVGLAPMQALQNIAVINGRPCLWGDAMLALVQKSGLVADFEETNPTGNSATCVSVRKGGRKVTTVFTMADAAKAGLASKAGPWTQYPKRMLQMRARAFNLRDNFPDVLKGLMIREEVEDYVELDSESFTTALDTIELVADGPPKTGNVEIVEDHKEDSPRAKGTAQPASRRGSSAPPGDPKPAASSSPPPQATGTTSGPSPTSPDALIPDATADDLYEQAAFAGMKQTAFKKHVKEGYGVEVEQLTNAQATELSQALQKMFAGSPG